MIEYMRWLNQNYYWWVRVSLWAWTVPSWYYLFVHLKSLGNPLPWVIVMTAVCVIATTGVTE